MLSLEICQGVVALIVVLSTWEMMFKFFTRRIYIYANKTLVILTYEYHVYHTNQMKTYFIDYRHHMLDRYGSATKLKIMQDNVVPDWIHYIYGSILLLSSLLGILTNGLVTFILIKQKQLKTTSNILILCLCVSDFILAFAGSPMVSISSFAKHWIFGNAGCIYYAFAMTMTGVFNIFILTLIAIERFVVIVIPRWRKHLTGQKVHFIVIFLVFFSLIWSTFPLVGWNSYTLENPGTACSITWQSDNMNDLSYCIALCLVAFVIPVIIISICYFGIYLKIRKQSKTVVNNIKTFAAKAEKAIAITGLMMIAAFILAWGPYAFYSMLVLIAGKHSVDPKLGGIPALFAKVSVFWNPLIYLYRNNEFRKALFQEFPFLKKCRRNNVVQESTMELQNTGYSGTLPLIPRSALNDPNNLFSATSTPMNPTCTVTKPVSSIFL